MINFAYLHIENKRTALENERAALFSTYRPPERGKIAFIIA
jgi:hypothetical protein